MKKPEILSPAGDFEKLQYAVAYGADAVYMAGKSYGMRTASGNFDEEELKKAVKYCHDRGTKAFVTVNVMAGNDEIDKLPPYLEFLDDAGVDALIVADVGIIPLVKRHAPHVRLHISTQASVTNYSAANMYHDMGADRIVLARELTIDDIAGIRAKTPKALEIETFVHGSMCMSYSGRCLLSNFMAGRDANHGNCAQPCRWSYSLVEEKRPGQYYPVVEDEYGTYLFNSKDMCLIEHIPELVRAGIDSFKIEGRVKTAYYAAVITNAYRRAVDMYAEKGEEFELPESLRREVEKVSHRDYYTGFYFGEKDGEYREDNTYIRDWEVCAYIAEKGENGLYRAVQKNKLSVGDRLELIRPGKDAVDFVLEGLYDMNMTPIDSAPHPKMEFFVKLPCEASRFAMLRKNNKPEKEVL